MNCAIISVGTELILGNTVNTSAAYIGRKLSEEGISLRCVYTIPDDFNRVADLLKKSVEKYDIIIFTGGLGPTPDDLTKEACCAALGLRLIYDTEIQRGIDAYFSARGQVAPDCNNKQALVPEGARILPNPVGTAPGFDITADSHHVFLLPGPPGELIPMFEQSVLPELDSMTDEAFYAVNIYTAGLGESMLAEQIKDYLDGERPTVATYCATGEVRICVMYRAASDDEARAVCEPVIEDIKKRLAPYVYGVDCGSLQNEAVRLLKLAGKHVATAESCTGGFIAKRITDIDGASDVFSCGIVSYSNEIKESVLGVSRQTLEKYGAVSGQTALEMAHGVSCVSGGNIGISSTGISGPTGGTMDKPVGLAYVALFDGETSIVREVRGSARIDKREFNRTITANAALKLLIDYLKNMTDNDMVQTKE